MDITLRILDKRLKHIEKEMKAFAKSHKEEMEKLEIGLFIG